MCPKSLVQGVDVSGVDSWFVKAGTTGEMGHASGKIHSVRMGHTSGMGHVGGIERAGTRCGMGQVVGME